MSFQRAYKVLNQRYECLLAFPAYHLCVSPAKYKINKEIENENIKHKFPHSDSDEWTIEC